jgi:hypothetical protein
MLIFLIYGLQNLQMQDLNAVFKIVHFLLRQERVLSLLNVQTFWQWQCHSWPLTRPKHMEDGWWLQMRCSKGRYSVIAGHCQSGEGARLRTITLQALVLVYCKITTLSFCAKHFAHQPSFLHFTQHLLHHKIILRHFIMSQNVHIYGPISHLKTKRKPLYLKTLSVPRCKHFSSRL